MKILALDHGARKIGAAVGEETIGIAHARSFFLNDKNFWNVIKEFCETEKIAMIVVGLPTALSGEFSEQTHVVKKFVAELNQVVQLPIVELDERFTTRLAEINLHLKELKSHEHKNFVDSESARILLQEWFEQKNIPDRLQCE